MPQTLPFENWVSTALWYIFSVFFLETFHSFVLVGNIFKTSVPE